MYCTNCGKELLPQDKFCSQCGKAVPPQATPISQGTATQASMLNRTWPNTSVPRETLVEMLVNSQHMLALNKRMAATPAMKSSCEKSAVVYTSAHLTYLACIKKADNARRQPHGVQLTPEPITAAERKAYLQEALAAAKSSITLEKKADLLAAIRELDNPRTAPQVISCPHCHKWTENSFTHCVQCYQLVNPSAPLPVPQAAGNASSTVPPQPAPRPTSTVPPQPAPRPASTIPPQPAPRPASTVPPQPAPRPAYTPQPQASSAQVRYADASMKKWQMLPGEKSLHSRQPVALLQPQGGKFTYYMEVTNQRILLSREGSGATVFGSVARVGGGLLGSLLAEGIKSAAGVGPKPWLEIPLTAVSDCGVRNKTEFFITADQTYVFQNKKYEKFLPELVANAKK